jgi:hypothetical protein
LTVYYVYAKIIAMLAKKHSPEAGPQTAKRSSGRTKTLVALSALGLSSAAFGGKQVFDGISHKDAADSAIAANDTSAAYNHRSAEAQDLGEAIMLSGLAAAASGGLLLTVLGSSSKPNSAADAAQPPRLSGQLYDGPDTTHHAEPPVEAVEARVEVPLTPPIEWQPPQADPHAVYRRP